MKGTREITMCRQS